MKVLKKQTKGFALIATIAIVALLVIIAVGITRISSTVDTSVNSKTTLERARANAKLALVRALAELQKNAGADTRITAPADAVAGTVATAPRNLTGVWRSWEGLDHDKSNGVPLAYVDGTIIPIYDIKLETGDLNDTADSSGNGVTTANNGRFLSWLISSYDASVHDASTPVNLSSATDTVPLLAEGTLGAGSAYEVHAVPITIEENTQDKGSYAWWITGNNSKAFIRNNRDEVTNEEEMVYRRSSSGVADASQFDFVNIDPANTELENLVSQQSFELVDNPTEPNEYYFDMTHTANGLLTNTANGGWKRDLSLFTDYIYQNERSATSVQSVTGKNVFTYSPNALRRSNTYYASGGQTISAGYDGCIYPWISEFRGRGHDGNALAISWHGISEYANMYRRITSTSGLPQYPMDNYIHKKSGTAGPKLAEAGSILGSVNQNMARLAPVIARTDYVFSFESELNTADNTYNLYMNIQPVVVMWNPYNVAIDYAINGSDYDDPTLTMRWGDTTYTRHFPFEVKVKVGSEPEITFEPESASIHNTNQAHLRFKINSFADTVLAPGECKVLGYIDPATLTSNLIENSDLEPNYIPGAGFKVLLTGKSGTREDGTEATLDAGISADVVQVGLNYPDYDHGTTAVSDSFAFDHYWHPYGGDKDDRSSTIWSDNTTSMTYESAFQTMPLPHAVEGYIAFSSTLGAMEDQPQDYFMATMGLRTIVQPPGSTVTNYVRTKGYYSNALGRTGESSYGNYATVDEPLAWNLTALTGGSGTSPDYFDIDAGVATGGDDAAFLAISNRASEGGVRRWAPNKAFYKPLHSIGDLTNADISPSSKYPPKMTDAFANSSAVSLIHQESVYLGYGRSLNNFTESASGEGELVTGLAAVANQPTNGSDVPGRYFFGVDHSYCSNHVLLDDWFVSSITPETNGFTATETRDIRQVYTDFLSGTAPLVNEFYKPVELYSGTELTDMSDNIDTSAANYDEDYYLKIASQLSVEGMFNINSTSYKAWASLLKSLNGVQKSDVLSSASSSTITNTSITKGQVAFERAGVSVVDDGSGIANEVMGSTTLTEQMIYDDNGTPSDLTDDSGLAVEIVKQIKLRGPFLSLSEFVNRQLSSNTDLALSGTVESALHELSLLPAAQNPFHAIQTALPQQATPRDADSGATFPEASEGYAAYGYPGWVRQADVIKSLLPVMSARDDSFTIRAYGSAVDSAGNTIEVWCEALVERTPEFVDSSNQITDYENISLINLKYGRKFAIRSFRWLTEDEV